MAEKKHFAPSAVGGALQDSIQYRGRKASRAKSEHRRRRILEAALDIAAREGVRGIKHRPVARAAGVPLASTTYYFRDIEELIRDAFMLFAEKANEDLEDFYGHLNALIDVALAQGKLHSDAGRSDIAGNLADYIAGYFGEQLRNYQSTILTEQVFLAEAMREPSLEGLAREYRRAWLNGVEQMLVRLGTANPRRDAALLISVVSGMGYDGLLFRDKFSPQFFRETLERVLSLLLDVRSAVESDYRELESSGTLE
ncbi:TetR/AcrR family transcriptional regulator [Marinobacter nanhaiticus D15-8W]|uniref:TetR family transcriptional regulator n=1 Tax=Marinobacter nanhaiticus D15-8W TaxID=626887 RepID=N6WS17_9GAMM|nr:TetR family transcriptional regulator C-terminal domain-containing protein [Marinobacter nanhaiticus]ENO13817.1 TetR family transcriptional regulator [Marinobacter nanhaiticus D15-8W]BES71191.1 TetR/AcrR family transcriptional regulator [Marinobacter nanhaiticus D15-8W]